MYSTELIRKFPDSPTRPILFVVYNQEMVEDATDLIRIVRGTEYFDENVTVVPLNTKIEIEELFLEEHAKYDVYIDPIVYKYQHSWNN